jgi:hypothetical protein
VVFARPEAGLDGHPAHGSLDARVANLIDPATALAHQVVMVLIGADDVGAATVIGVQAVQYTQLDKEVERPENRCPTDAPGLELVVKLSGRELAVLAQDRLDDRAAGIGLSKAQLRQLAQHLSSLRAAFAPPSDCCLLAHQPF